MRKPNLPVLLSVHLEEALEQGAWAEVECVEVVEKGGNTHRGGWIVYFIVDYDGELVRSVYVTMRGLKPRVFKTVAGLSAFAIDLGVEVFVCPFKVGERGTWIFEKSKLPPDLRPYYGVLPPARGSV